MVRALFIFTIKSRKGDIKCSKKIKAWLQKHIDYQIVDSYYETGSDGHYHVKHRKKYYFKK